MVHGTNDDHVPFAGGVGDAQIPGGWYDHLPIEDTAAWWSKQGADVATVWRSGGHVWPAGEAEMQWAWMRGMFVRIMVPLTRKAPDLCGAEPYAEVVIDYVRESRISSARARAAIAYAR
jgi:hypothetical protein